MWVSGMRVLLRAKSDFHWYLWAVNSYNRSASSSLIKLETVLLGHDWWYSTVWCQLFWTELQSTDRTVFHQKQKIKSTHLDAFHEFGLSLSRNQEFFFLFIFRTELINDNYLSFILKYVLPSVTSIMREINGHRNWKHSFAIYLRTIRKCYVLLRRIIFFLKRCDLTKYIRPVQLSEQNVFFLNNPVAIRTSHFPVLH